MTLTARRFAIPVATLVLVAGLAAPAARAADHRLEIHIAGEDHGAVNLSLDGTLAAALIGALAPAQVDCSHDTDAETVAMMRYLEAHPEGRYKTWRHHEQVTAQRRGNQVALHVVDRHGESVDVELPWSLARCALGYPAGLGEALLSRDGLHIKVDGDRGSVRIDIH